MAYLQWSLWVVGVGLQMLLLSALIRGAYRTFPVLFAYSVALFLTTVVEAAALAGSWRWTSALERYYWVNEAIRQLFIYCLVISLIYRSMEDTPTRATMRRGLVLAAAALMLLSVPLSKAPLLALWMTRVSRNLSFFAVVMNLVLWLALIRQREKDRRLLLVSGGLGIQMTGEAIGQSLRQLSRATVWPGNILLFLSHFLCLYIWWQTFRRDGPVGAAQAPGRVRSR